MRKDKLRCSVCYKKDWARYEVWKQGGITWQNIEVSENGANSVKCECKNCGHTYISRSSAAFRTLRVKQQNLNK